MTAKFILLISALLCCCRLNDLIAQKAEFPTELKTWCPHSSFCEEETRYSTEKGVEPCCSSCSCSKDCGRKRNCCKYEYDVYKLDETLDTVCKQLNVFSDIDVENDPYFHIIDKCPNRSETCSSRNLTGPKSFFPVYSRDSGMLYYNEDCASCHKQRNIMPFITLLSCDKTNFGFLQKSYKKLVDAGCTLKLIPPNDIDLSTEVCNPILISNCSSFFKGKKSYVDFCHSFNATFRTHSQTKYRNVFCYFCQTDRRADVSDWIDKFEFCPTDNNQKVEGNLPYTVLLGTSAKNLARNEDILEERSHTPILCNHETKEDCRPVFCPEGQIYHKGKCKILGKQWYFRMMRINVRLPIPASYQKTLTVYQLNMNGSNGMNFYLKRYGLQDSQLTLSYNLAPDNMTIRFFLAMLYYERLTVEPNTFMERVKISLRTTWKLYTKKNVFFLKPHLNRFIRYDGLLQDTKKFHFPISLHRKDETGLSIESSYESLKEVIRFIAGPKTVPQLQAKEAFFITKLFFCKLVELRDNEFEDYYIRLAMKNRSIYLMDGEFTWIYRDQSHKPVICSYDLPGLSKASTLAFVSLLISIGQIIYHCLFCDSTFRP